MKSFIILMFVLLPLMGFAQEKDSELEKSVVFACSIFLILVVGFLIKIVFQEVLSGDRIFPKRPPFKRGGMAP